MFDESNTISSVSVFDGVEMFDVVDRDGESSFLAYGYRTTGTLPGKAVLYEMAPEDPLPSGTALPSLSFRVRGTAVHRGYRVRVGSAVGPSADAGRMLVEQQQPDGTWTTPAILVPSWPSQPFVEVVTTGHNGFLAVGNNAVWMTGAMPLGYEQNPPTAFSDDPTQWSNETATVNALFPEGAPTWRDAVRVGDAVVLVGDNGAVAAWRPKPPGIMRAYGTPNPTIPIDWEPVEWTRLRLTPAATDPQADIDLTAVAVDEVQEVLQRDDGTVNGRSWREQPFPDGTGWLIATTQDGRAVRFGLKARTYIPNGADEVFGLEPTYEALGIEFITLPDTCPENANHALSLHAVFVDSRTRAFGGTCGRLFTLPKAAPFSADRVRDVSPAPIDSVDRAQTTWYGIASDGGQVLLAGSGLRTSSATATFSGLVARGAPKSLTCAVRSTALSPIIPPHLDMTFDITECTPAGSVSLPGWADLAPPVAKVDLNIAGQPDAQRPSLTTQGNAATLLLDDDRDSNFEVWSVSTVINSGHPLAGEQVDVLVFPDVFGAPAALGPYEALVEDLVHKRTQLTFYAGQSPRPFVNGHVRNVITHDILTGIALSTGAEPTTPVLDLPIPDRDSLECSDYRQDRVATTAADTVSGPGEENIAGLIAGFSRFRSGDGHAYVDDYEGLGEGRRWRHQSMKHYIKGRCYDYDPTWDSQTINVWTSDCCDNVTVGEVTETVVKPKTFDVYSPITGTAYILRSTSWIQAENEPNFPAATDPAHNVRQGDDLIKAVYSYLGGSRLERDGTERPCSYYNADEDWQIQDLPEDGEILAIVHPDGNLAFIVDHGHWCIEPTGAGGVPVQGGDRLGVVSIHGTTEVSMWVNDQGSRWRLVSYFDELPDNLYNLYAPSPAEIFTTVPFSARTDTASPGHPVIPLEVRDACPVEPVYREYGMNEVQHNEHPDLPTYRYVCNDDPNRPRWRPSCTNSDCPSEFIWRTDLIPPTVSE